MFLFSDELLSPVVTPLILIFQLSHKSQEIVDFFRNFTVDVVGVGDVCSFAQMDVRRHGNPGWQAEQEVERVVAKTNHYTQAEDGKTEMSLVHFTLTNPGWKPSGENERYLAGLKEAAERDVTQLATMPEDDDNPMYSSISGLEQMGGSYRSLALNVLNSVPSPPPDGVSSPPPPPVPSPPPDTATTSYAPVLRGGLSRCAGPLTSSRSLLGQSRLLAPTSLSPRQPVHGLPGMEFSQADMAMSALYLHNINHRTVAARPPIGQVSGYRFQMGQGDGTGEREPLIQGLES